MKFKIFNDMIPFFIPHYIDVSTYKVPSQFLTSSKYFVRRVHDIFFTKRSYSTLCLSDKDHIESQFRYLRIHSLQKSVMTSSVVPVPLLYNIVIHILLLVSVDTHFIFWLTGVISCCPVNDRKFIWNCVLIYMYNLCVKLMVVSLFLQISCHVNLMCFSLSRGERFCVHLCFCVLSGNLNNRCSPPHYFTLLVLTHLCAAL